MRSVDNSMRSLAPRLGIAGLHRIISGPGGNMWFTEMNEDKVGYIIPAAAP